MHTVLPVAVSSMSSGCFMDAIAMLKRCDVVCTISPFVKVNVAFAIFPADKKLFTMVMLIVAVMKLVVSHSSLALGQEKRELILASQRIVAPSLVASAPRRWNRRRRKVSPLRAGDYSSAYLHLIFAPSSRSLEREKYCSPGLQLSR